MVMGGDNGGFMVKDDQQEFTARVLDLLENDELYRKKSGEARLHAMTWSIGEITRKLADIYKETITAYLEDYGRPRSPVWELIIDKRWWKINNKIIRKKTKKKLHEIRLKLKSQTLLKYSAE
jgi:hypothetical protein